MLDKYIYHRPETNQDEIVLPERFCWEAYFIHGTVLKQFDDATGIFHQLREIHQPQLKTFRMINYSTGKFFDIQWHSSRKLIHIYKNLLLENGTIKIRLYCFGYETHMNGINHTVIMVILPDDNIIVTEDVNTLMEVINFDLR